MTTTRTLLIVGMVLLAAASRVAPHPPNFTPIAAMALFGAAQLPSPLLAFLLPLAALLLGDVGLQVLTGLGLGGGWMAAGSGFYQGMWFVYGSVVLITALGLLLRTNHSVWSIGAAVLASSVLFFVLTNFGVWAVWDMYPKTAAGLFECYLAALPFFHWTLLGDVCYATLLFGGFALAVKFWPQLANSPSEALATR